MNTWESFTTGISPHHIPALVAAGLLPFAVWLVRRLRPGGRRVPQSASMVDRWAAWLLGIAAVIHLALPIGDHDNTLFTVGFLGSGIAYACLALRAAAGRPYKALSAALIVATLIAYLTAVFSGAEGSDQVGIAAALDELFALTLVCSAPSRQDGRPRRARRLVGSTAATALTLVVGAGIWISALQAHQPTDIRVATTANPSTTGGGTGESDAHDHADLAQAGFVTRAVPNQAATPAQVTAAADLVARTKAATAKYTDIHAALADGYQMPSQTTGFEVHLEKKANQHDRSILDPDKPKSLVYAIIGDSATLLGVLYQMPDAGVPGPAVGGSITRWHAHDGCVSLTPPGLGIVSPFGTCPPLSVQVTTAEMMHVWVLDSPAGPFADGLDKNWVRAYNATRGVPYP